MIDNGLLGKVVKTDNYHFIGFLYPNFPFVGHLSHFNTENIPGIIYTGSEHLVREAKTLVTKFLSKEDLSKTGIKKFISTYSADGKYDIDLTDIKSRVTLLDLVYSKHKLDYTQYLDDDMLKYLLNKDEQTFYDFLKLCWLFEEQCTNTENMGLYSSKAIFKLLNKSIKEIYTKILSIESDTALDSLELAFAHFITDAKMRNYIPNKSDEKNAMLKTFDNSTRGKENEIVLIFSKYRNMSHNKKIKLIWLFTEFKKQIKTEEEHNAD